MKVGWVVAATVAIVAVGCGHRSGDGEAAPAATATTAIAAASPDTAAPSTSLGAASGAGKVRTVGDHREVDLRFTSRDTGLAGTLFLPVGGGAHPAVVWVHASGEHERLRYGPLVDAFVKSGIGLFSYDKRGVGESGGTCCPADADDAGVAEFGEQANDALAALEAVRSRPEVNADHVGYLGVSQAGWIVPIAATQSPHVAFAVLVSGATVTTGEEQFYSQLTGDSDLSDDAARAELSRRLAEHGPSGFDPKPYLAAMTIPGLWLFGSVDGSIPTIESEAVLDALKSEGHDFDHVEFAGAGHGLLDVAPPPPPEVVPTIVHWVSEHAN
jgi:uncharacterized protein